MTQQLTIEQLRFARSIGAVYCVKSLRRITGHHLKNGNLGKPGFVYRGEWDAWDDSDVVSDPNLRFEIDFSPLEYTPKVGEECEVRNKFNKGDWTKITPDYVGHEVVVFKIGDELDDVIYFSLSEFRPLPDPEQQRREELLSKWRGQSLDYAHDTEKTPVSLGQVFEFIAGLE